MNSDKPVTNPDEDKFQRAGFAHRIAQTIIQRQSQDSMTIGLYGKWGEGKTSVMEFISSELLNSAIIMRFNPWQILDDHQILDQFFIQFSEILKIKLDKFEKIAKALEDYGGVLSMIPLPYFSISKDVTDAASKMLGKVNIQTKRNVIVEALLKIKIPIVVFIDDIDRLELSQIQSVFRLVKTIADFPNTIYLLSLDPDKVSVALSPIFGDGRMYLEKIIQVPLTIPKARQSALYSYTYESINKALLQTSVNVSLNDLNFYKKNADAYLFEFIQTPRDAARIQNALIFSLPMLKDEVNIGELILLEILKILLPDLYHSIRDSRDIYLSSYSQIGLYNNYNEIEEKKKYAIDTIEGHLSNLSSRKKVSMKGFLTEIFPQLNTLYHNRSYAGDDTYKEWHIEKRLCSGQYFDRYFTYSIAEGEISDIEFAKLLSILQVDSVLTIVSQIENILLYCEPSELLLKFRFYEGVINQNQQVQLSRSLCLIAGKFYVKEGLSITNNMTLKKILRDCVQNQPLHDRIKVASEQISTLNPISISFDMYDELWEQGRRNDVSDYVMSLEDLVTIESVLLDRIYKTMTSANLFKTIDDHAIRLFFYGLFQHGTDITTLKLELNSYLGDDKNAPIAIISAVTPTIYSTRLNKKEPTRTYIKTEISKDDYALLCHFVDVDYLYERTIKMYGQVYYVKDESNSSYTELTDIELIGCFQKMHND